MARAAVACSPTAEESAASWADASSSFIERAITEAESDVATSAATSIVTS